MIPNFTVQCPVCYWVKGDSCDDWHWADRKELDVMAKVEICPYCILEAENKTWKVKKP